MSAQAFDVDLNSVARLGNDFLWQLNQLRELEPVHWSAASQCWIITRHQDVDDALQGKFPLSLKRLVSLGLAGVAEADRARLFPTIMKYMPHWIIEIDPPDHTRQRKLLVKAFSKKVVEGMQPFVRARVAALMDKLVAQPQIEFNEEIARQLPGSVILELIGLPQEQMPRLRGWAQALAEGLGRPFVPEELLARVDRAMAEMNDVLVPLIEDRRVRPREDLLTSMIQAVDGGDALTLDEMLGALHVIIVAGHDTTSNTLTLGTVALAQQPQFWQHMQQNPERSLESSLELMRYVAMSTSQPRVVAADFVWHGKSLKRGDFVFLMLAAANRDPRMFGNPEAIEPGRANIDRSMVFAPGMHHCIGHLLAKMQVSEFFSALVQRFSGVELLDPVLHFMPQIAFRGVYDLNVRFKLRAKG